MSNKGKVLFCTRVSNPDLKSLTSFPIHKDSSTARSAYTDDLDMYDHSKFEKIQERIDAK